MAATVRSLVSLLLVMTFTVLIYTRVRVSRETGVEELEKVTTPYTKPLQIQGRTHEHDKNSETVNEHERKVVILLSNQRSGSSFVGDFFSHNNEAFYLFEPLLPYGMSCNKLSKERIEFLQKISLCEFDTLIADYKTAYSVGGVRSHRECLRYHLCSIGKHKALLKRYNQLCFASMNQSDQLNSGLTAESCNGPLKLDIWSSLCRSSRIVAFKILRVCSLRELERMDAHLLGMGYKMHVIELVRDPRGIVNSALKLELKLSDLEGRLNIVCGRYKRNMDYIENTLNTADSKGIKRYMRIRFEDIADDPAGAAMKIYKFIGERVPDEVSTWLEMATAGPKRALEKLKKELNDGGLDVEEKQRLEKQIAMVSTQGNNPYGTTRNSSNIPLKWRKRLSMDVVTKIQDQCGEVMNKLNYKFVRDSEEKGNYSIKLY